MCLVQAADREAEAGEIIKSKMILRRWERVVRKRVDLRRKHKRRALKAPT